MNPYKILGVSQDAKQDEIKAAYRKLAKKLHPDLNPGNKSAETKFKEINTAYEMIGTPEERAKFDRGETQDLNDQSQRRRSHNRGSSQDPFYYYETQRPGARYTSSTDGFDPSIFADLFGEHGFDGRKTKGPRRGEDHHYSLEVDFLTSILGGEQEISLPTGKKLRVKIPTGIKSGTKLRLANQGEKVSEDTNLSGDAYIEITVRPSALFKRIDHDIEVELPLSLNEAILGGEIRVPTVDGPVLLRIPAGLTTGSRVRMKGKGVPTKEGRGDQYALIQVTTPPHIDAELKKFMEEWGKTHSYNPREAVQGTST